MSEVSLDTVIAQAQAAGGNRLYLERAELTDLRFLEALPGLKELILSGCKVRSLRGLEAAPGLEKVRISGCTITDFEPLAQLPGLVHLEVMHSGLRALPEGLASTLRSALLNSNPLTSVRPLLQCRRLESVDLSYTEVQSTEELGALCSLITLDRFVPPARAGRILALGTMVTPRTEGRGCSLGVARRYFAPGRPQRALRWVGEAGDAVERDLFRAVVERPSDVAARERYGQYLLGHGEARGRYLAGNLPLDRKTELLIEGECEWFSAVWELITDCAVRDGFAERVTIAAKEASVGPTLVRRTPLRQLEVDYWGFHQAIGLSSLPWLARVDTLTLSQAPVDELESLGAGEALAALERLTVMPETGSLPAGFADARLPGLRSLFVGHVHSSAPEALRVIANATHLGSLEEITLWQDSVGVGSLEPLLRSPHLKSLRRVNTAGLSDEPETLERLKGVWREIEWHSEAGATSY